MGETPNEQVRRSISLTARAEKMLKRLDWDRDRALRDARLFAQHAISVLPAEVSPARTKAYEAAERVLRDLATLDKNGQPAAAPEVDPRLARMWHPDLNGRKRVADVPGLSMGKYWWQCVDVVAHDRPWLATMAQAQERHACPECEVDRAVSKGGQPRKKKGSAKTSKSVWAVSGGLPTLGRRR